jgi:diguanylate cyclase (GGDEF)-like protein
MASGREGWSALSLERLVQILDRLAGEGRLDRLAPAALDAALAVTGARAGRVTGPPRDGRPVQLAAEGTPAPGAPTLAADVPGRSAALGRIEVWSVADDPPVLAALRMVARQYGQALERSADERSRADDRRRARRLAEAAEAMRAAREPRQAVEIALEHARALMRAPAAAMVAGGSYRLEVAACDGIEALSEAELAELVPSEVRPALIEGLPWSGVLPAAGALRARGWASAAVAPVGQNASLGFLAVVGEGETPAGPDDLEALGALAGHAATALTMSVLRHEVRELGSVDPLTRFFNARYLQGRVDQECQRALRAGVSVSLAVMRLDGIGALRADGREAAADAALEALAAHVAGRLRAMDVGCRVSQDELVAILPEVGGIEALRVGERLRQSLRGEEALSGFTLSVGVASFPDQAGTPERLLANAREALDWARRDGGDRTFLYHSDAAEILRAEERDGDADHEALITTVSALATAIDARHPSTVRHAENVARLSALIAAELGLAPERVEDVRIAGLLHDVGKIGVREELVVKAGPLTDAERDELRRHPEIGERMLSGPRLATVRPAVLHHHERMDGRGYPAGLAGQDIPLEARILAVANAFDRLSCGGPSSVPLPLADVMGELERRSGPELDPAVVEALRSLVGRGAAGVAPRAT